MENTYENFKRFIDVTTFECDCKCNNCIYRGLMTPEGCFGRFDNFNIFLREPASLIEYIKRYAKEAYQEGSKFGGMPIG